MLCWNKNMALALKTYDVAEHLDSEDELRRYLHRRSITLLTTFRTNIKLA
jgi:DNA-binding phage protein